MNMETKSAAVEFKTNSTPGEFTAVISAIGNVDRQGDRAMPGFLSKTMSLDPIPPCYWSHMHQIPPIGDGIEWFEQGSKEIVYKGALFVKGDDEHQYAKMVYAGMKSRDGRPPAINQFSYTYGVPDGGAERIMEGGKSIRLLHEVRPVPEVGPCFMGANADTYQIDPPKSNDVGQLVIARQNLGRRISMKELLAETLGVKDYGDIDGWEIRMLLDMVDTAVSFIQASDEDNDIVKMQTVAGTLLAMLTDEFAEVTGLLAQGEAIEQIISGDPSAVVEVDVTLVSASTDAETAGLDKKDDTATAVVVPATEPVVEPEAAVEPPADAPAETPAEVPAPAAEAPAEAAAVETEPPADEAPDVTSDDASTVSHEDEIARLQFAGPFH